jgi:hypothetical protein
MPEAKLKTSPYFRAMERSTADETFTGSARGAGKTFTVLFQILMTMAEKPGYQAVFFRRNFADLSKTVFPAVKSVISMIGPNIFTLVENQNPRVYCDNGSTMHFSAAETVDDTGKFQGANIHRLVVDEAQLIKPEVLETVTAIVRSSEGDYKVRTDWLANPCGPGQAWLKRRFIYPAKKIALRGNIKHPQWKHPTTDEYFDVENHWKFTDNVKVREDKFVPFDIEVWLVKTWMNPTFEPDGIYIANLKRTLKDNVTKAAQWIENDWDAVVGEFFPNVGIAEARVHIEPEDKIICGIDPGQRKTAVVWAAVDTAGRYKVFNSRVYHGVDIPDKVAMIKREYADVDLYVIDPAARATQEGGGSRSIILQYQMAGIPNLVPCISNKRHHGWEALRTGFADGSILIDKRYCVNLIESLSGLKTKENDSEDCDKDDGTELQDDGDHLSDALRYLFVNGFQRGMGREGYVERETRKAIEKNPELLDRLKKSVGIY